MIVGVRKWALAVGAGMVMAAGLATAWSLRKPEPCRETAVLIDDYGDAVCEPGQRLEVVGANPNSVYASALIHCHCPEVRK